MPDYGSASDGSDVFRLHRAAEKALEKIQSTIRHSDMFHPYAVRARVKRIKDIQEKIVRKQKDRPSYCLSDIMDIVGIRFVTLYREDILDIVGAIIELLTGHAEVQPNHIHKCQLTEFKHYISQGMPEADKLSSQIKIRYHSIYSDSPAVAFEQIFRALYSSVHMVLLYTVEIEDDEYIVPFEIQFRSVFEDAWGEIDHKLLYEAERHGHQPDDEQKAELSQHLGVLKKMMDAAAEYADVIRRSVSPRPQPPGPIKRSLDDDYLEYVTDISRTTGVRPDLSQDLVGLVEAKLAVDKSIDKSGNLHGTTQSYIEIAERFADFVARLEVAQVGAEKTKQAPLIYIALMEEALCRLLANDPLQTILSVGLYRDIVGAFDASPPAWFRLGQALARQSEQLAAGSPEAVLAGDEAFAAYENARKRLASMKKMTPSAQRLVSSKQQQQYIEDNLGRLQGFVRWRVSDRRRRETQIVSESDLRDVVAAFQIAYADLVGRPAGNLRTKQLNNVTYYAVEAMDLSQRLDMVIEGIPDQETLQPLLEELKEICRAAPTVDVLRWDTIVQACEFVDDTEGAREGATIVWDEYANLDATTSLFRTAYAKEGLDRAVKRAWTVLRNKT